MADTEKRASGIEIDGTWLPAFAGQRRPFGLGNQAAQKHGAYASKLGVRVDEIAEELKVSMGDTFDEAFAPTVHLLAITLCRIERAFVPVVEGEENPSLTTALLGWINTAKRLCETLGLTPLSRARLDLNLALTDRTRNGGGEAIPAFPESQAS